MAKVVKFFPSSAYTHGRFTILDVEERNLLQTFCQRHSCETCFGAFMLLGVVSSWHENFFKPLSEALKYFLAEFSQC